MQPLYFAPFNLVTILFFESITVLHYSSKSLCICHDIFAKIEYVMHIPSIPQILLVG
jgi:hypothetical protein